MTTLSTALARFFAAAKDSTAGNTLRLNGKLPSDIATNVTAASVGLNYLHNYPTGTAGDHFSGVAGRYAKGAFTIQAAELFLNERYQAKAGNTLRRVTINGTRHINNGAPLVYQGWLFVSTATFDSTVGGKLLVPGGGMISIDSKRKAYNPLPTYAPGRVTALVQGDLTANTIYLSKNNGMVYIDDKGEVHQFT